MIAALVAVCVLGVMGTALVAARWAIRYANAMADAQALAHVQELARTEAMYRRAMDTLAAATTIGMTERREAVVAMPEEHLPAEERLARRIDSDLLDAGAQRVVQEYAAQGYFVTEVDARAEAALMLRGMSPTGHPPSLRALDAMRD